MPPQQVSDHSSDDDVFYSLSVHGEDDVTSDHLVDALMAPPVHPCPQLQAAFEESILESTEHLDGPQLDSSGMDAEMRRRNLLDVDHGEDSAVMRWKRRPGAKYHPFVKLIAQLVFGMHLLEEGQARSNAEVVKILQNHVNEMDAFLERTAEDFALAITDIEERIRYLKLPMQHMDIFGVMLDEKKFRTDLVNGNEKIEKIISRTAQAMNAAMHDIHNGIKSIKELSTYLDRVEKRWPADKRDVGEVFAAMRGNEQGWISCLRDLRTKGDNLRNTLVILEGVIGEISRHAAAASRRNTLQGRKVSVGTQHSAKSSLRSKYTKDTPSSDHKKPSAWLDKPLPQEPGSLPSIKQATMAKPHPVPLATRFEQPRQAVPAPRKSSSPHSPDRTRTSSRSSVARDSTVNVQENAKRLSDFFHWSGPLRSHPPDTAGDHWSSDCIAALSQSQAGAHSPDVAARHFRRSRSGDAMYALPDSNSVPRPASRHVPRKPAGSINRDDGTAPAVLKFQIPRVGDGFSRRISRRLKNIPAPILSTHHTQSSAPAPQSGRVPQPNDSAYAFSRDEEAYFDGYKDEEQQDTSSHHDVAEREQDSALEAEKQLSVNPEKDAPRSESRGGHRLFPNVERPLTPLQAVRSDTKKLLAPTTARRKPQTRTRRQRAALAVSGGSSIIAKATVEVFYSRKKVEPTVECTVCYVKDTS